MNDCKSYRNTEIQITNHKLENKSTFYQIKTCGIGMTALFCKISAVKKWLGPWHFTLRSKANNLNPKALDFNMLQTRHGLAAELIVTPSRKPALPSVHGKWTANPQVAPSCNWSKNPTLTPLVSGSGPWIWPGCDPNHPLLSRKHRVVHA